MENFDCRYCAEKIKENINAPVIIAVLLGLIAGFVIGFLLSPAKKGMSVNVLSNNCMDKCGNLGSNNGNYDYGSNDECCENNDCCGYDDDCCE